jgi:hypothetical protein
MLYQLSYAPGAVGSLHAHPCKPFANVQQVVIVICRRVCSGFGGPAKWGRAARSACLKLKGSPKNAKHFLGM